MKELSSREANQVSGEIDPNKAEGLEHLENSEASEASPEEKRAARVIKYQEMLTREEAKLEEYSDDKIREKADRIYEKELERSGDGDMAARLRDAMKKNLTEEAATISKYAEEIRTNIAKLEAGQDELYNEN